ncbi:MAG: phosphate signaling complex protein PhoU [Deltaproteobacteria bacterium]|nr:phosphate signaling complex protein PhoU [Deltaproteobacteria bacterium]MBW2130775.1 phosphate signaling complex protein PhoU [Deltaproteobacteria bacterium]MBW2302238.1 phosphate signaling complex protein PhoU [Deltaproteobacteria bacterium]
MSVRLQKELEKIKRQILSLGALVEERVRLATKAIETKDENLAEEIRRRDYEIDELEMEVEEACLKILALHQPVAVDLRFLVAVIKINNELERIGDEAVNVAKRVRSIARGEGVNISRDYYSLMAEKTTTMLKGSLDALVNQDRKLAVKIMKLDNQVDSIHSRNYDDLKEVIRKNPGRVDDLINFLTISRHLERIADHATNICQEVIFMIEGEIVRHGRWEQIL